MANGHLSETGGSAGMNDLDSANNAIPVSPWQQWPEFCETEAHKSAMSFAICYREYAAGHPELGTKDKAKQYANRYVKHFLEHFDYEMNKCLGPFLGLNAIGNHGNADYGIANYETASHQNVQPLALLHSRHGSFQSTLPPLIQESDSTISNHQNGNGNLLSVPSEASLQSREDLRGEPRSKKVGVRRMSFKQLGHNIRNKFRKQQSADLDKWKNESEAVVRDGIVNNLTGEDQQGRSMWEKSRLLLVNRPEGLILEFYAPPKSTKPKAGIFCFLIEEVRETTELELPGTKHAFALKAENNLEFVMEAQSVQDMQSWLSSIQDSMRQSRRGSSLDRRRPLPTVPVTEHQVVSRRNQANLTVDITLDGSSLDRSPNTSPPPQIPPREPCMQRASSSTSSDPPITPVTIPDGMVLAGSPENDHPLATFPWFHGTLSRVDAAQLVLQGGHTCHGVFLVRQSETRRGECVLTFNFHGRPKHLRLQLDPDGKCKVTHIWFDSIFDMLDHFRTHTIPLDSRDGSSEPDVSLTVYVPNTIGTRTSSSADSSDGNIPFDMNGMPRSEFTSLGDSFLLPISDPPMVRGGVSNEPSEDNHRGRAVKNQYAFV